MRPTDLLRGPAPAWPRPVDAVLELWARLPPRPRIAARAVLLVLAAVAATGGLLRGPWGPPVTVLVVTAEVPAGAPVGVGDVARATRPADLVPPDALRDEHDLPPGSWTRALLPAGTVLTAAHVATAGPAGLAGPGHVAVPVDATTFPAIAVGSRLDLAVAGHDGTARVVARDASVVADDGTWRWIAVPRDVLGEVAAGVNAGTLVPALLPPPPAAAPSAGR